MKASNVKVGSVVRTRSGDDVTITSITPGTNGFLRFGGRDSKGFVIAFGVKSSDRL